MHDEMTTPHLSAIILANGSVNALQATLETATAIADETLVLATAESSEYEQLELPTGARWIESSAVDHRANLRNAALEQARGNWVLWLEAGEILPPETHATVRDFVGEAADPRTVYWAFIVLPVEHGNVASEQFAQIRLHPHQQGLRFKGRVRESLLPAVAQCGLQVEGLSLQIQRLAAAIPAFEARTAAQHEQQLAQQALAESRPSAEIYNCLGDCAQRLGEWGDSERYYREALSLAEEKSPASLEAYYGILAALDARSAERQLQVRLCMEAIEQFPLDAQLLCALGGYLQSQGHTELAIRSYGVAMHHGRIEPTVTHLSNILELAAASQADVYIQAEQWAKADTAVAGGLEMFPDSQRLLRHQLQLAIRRGDEHATIACAARIEVAESLRNTFTSAVHGALAATDGNLTIARAQLETAWRAGWRDPLCYQWLADVQMSQEDWNAAHLTLDAWQTLQPRSSEMHRARQRWQAGHGKPTIVDHDYDFEIAPVVEQAESPLVPAAPQLPKSPANSSQPNLRVDKPAGKSQPVIAPLAQKLAAARSAVQQK